jgi:hypothetical protein
MSEQENRSRYSASTSSARRKEKEKEKLKCGARVEAAHRAIGPLHLLTSLTEEVPDARHLNNNLLQPPWPSLFIRCPTLASQQMSA